MIIITNIRLQPDFQSWVFIYMQAYHMIYGIYTLHDHHELSSDTLSCWDSQLLSSFDQIYRDNTICLRRRTTFTGITYWFAAFNYYYQYWNMQRLSDIFQAEPGLLGLLLLVLPIATYIRYIPTEPGPDLEPGSCQIIRLIYKPCHPVTLCSVYHFISILHPCSQPGQTDRMACAPSAPCILSKT